MSLATVKCLKCGIDIWNSQSRNFRQLCSNCEYVGKRASHDMAQRIYEQVAAKLIPKLSHEPTAYLDFRFAAQHALKAAEIWQEETTP